MFKKKHTKDRQTKDRSNFYTVGKLGKTREVTPEGYLLCRDVAIACTGSLLYGKGEVPVTADAGLIVITRGDDDLFRPETIASFEGKPVTNDHPDDWVKPENWKDLAKGVAQNVRRGEGIEDHLLIADLLIQDQETINAVQDGKVEISLGYDADYQEVSKGKGVQSNIIGNHVALVDKGRCGSRCSIGDKQMAKKKISFADRIRNLVKTKDADEAEKLAKAVEDEDLDIETKDSDDDNNDDRGEGKTADTLSKIMKKLNTMDAEIKSLKKTKDSDDPKEKTGDGEDDPDEEKTKDGGDLTKAEPAKKLDEGGVEKYTGDSLQEIRARAEILAPGLKLPTLDSSAKDVGKVADTAKRNALKLAYATADGIKTVGPFVGGANANIDALPTHTVDAAFIGASELIKQQNNAKGVRTGVTTRDFGRSAPTPADINAKNRAFWNKG